MAKAKKKEALSLEEKLEQALVPLDKQQCELPENWCWTYLRNIAQWGSGGTPSRKNPVFYEGNIPWVKTGELEDDYLYDTEEKISDEAIQKSSAKLFPIESVLIAMYGATIGKTAILGVEATTNQACACAICNESVYNKYLFYYLRSQKDNFIEQGKGGAQPNISQDIIKKNCIPLPPKAEQQRIVEQIESLFVKLDEAKEKAEYVVESFQLHKDAVLHKAFSGEYTKKWRKENQVSKESWKKVKLGELLKPMQSRLPQGETFRYIDIDAIDNKRQVIREAKNILTSEAPSRASRAVEEGAILFSMVRPYLKNIAYVENEMADCIASTGFYVCRCKENLDSRFLYEFLRSKDAIDYLMQFMKGDNSPSIRKDDLLGMIINLPSYEEQQQIIFLLNDLLLKEEQAKDKACEVIDSIELMKKSILTKAFRGELGTNNPDEESSVELLKSILETE